VSAETSERVREPSSFSEATHATACYVLAAALTAVLISLGLPVQADPFAGEPLFWLQRSADLFSRFLPWVILAAVVYLAPVMHVLRAKAPLPIALILSAIVGSGPAILLFAGCFVIPPLRSLAPVIFPLFLFGVMVSLVGFAIHAVVREHLVLVVVAAGIVTVGGLVTSAVAV